MPQGVIPASASARGVVAVREVAAAGEAQAHDPVVRLQNRRVRREVRRRAGVRLDVHVPLVVLQREPWGAPGRFQGCVDVLALLWGCFRNVQIRGCVEHSGERKIQKDRLNANHFAELTFRRDRKALSKC